MPTPREQRAALQVLTAEAVGVSLDLLARLNGPAEVRRAALLEGVPGIIDYYSDGSAALALDFYEEQRELVGGMAAFAPVFAVEDRTVANRRAIAWAAAPLLVELDDLDTAAGRLAEVVQLEVARANRGQITTNRLADPQCVGWRRITAGGCKFCRMLADKGAVYMRTTATFAAHPNCHCTAQPVFVNSPPGPEASVMQYTASRRGRSAAQKQALREYLDTYY